MEVLPPDHSVSTEGTQPVLAAYILYLIAILTAVPSLVAVAVAYIFRDGAPAWLQTHYRYLIRTFWLMCLYIGIGALTWIFIVGMGILALVPFWMGARCVVGLRALHHGRPVNNPGTWLI